VSRPTKPACDLTDTEKRDLTQPIACVRGRRAVAVGVIAIIGNDTMTLVPVNVG